MIDISQVRLWHESNRCVEFSMLTRIWFTMNFSNAECYGWIEMKDDSFVSIATTPKKSRVGNGYWFDDESLDIEQVVDRLQIGLRGAPVIGTHVYVETYRVKSTDHHRRVTRDTLPVVSDEWYVTSVSVDGWLSRVRWAVEYDIPRDMNLVPRRVEWDEEFEIQYVFKFRNKTYGMSMDQSYQISKQDGW